jgi:soluble lytic murein transglycosylase
LRAGNWTVLNETIAAMTAREKREPAWRYWKTRADAASGDPARLASARVMKEALAKETNFYGLLAAEELGVEPIPDWNGIAASVTEMQMLAGRPAIMRTLALYRLGLKEEGLREWQYATRNLNDQQLLAAAELARENNIADRAISAADRAQGIQDFSRRYPIPYRDDLQGFVRAQSLDQAWVYGLIRQESRFMPDAKSAVGATGLMQLMPTTARWAAQRVGIKPFSQERILEVPVNLNLGVYYLRHVLDSLGHPVLATAAYNAGPNRARRWQADIPLEGAIYAECIPFNETRDYVKKVMANSWFYARRLGSGKPRLKDLMGTVPARGDTRAYTFASGEMPPDPPPTATPATALIP